MNVRHDFWPCADTPRPPLPAARPRPETPARSGRLRSFLVTGTALAALWAGLHWDDPASWVVGGPTVLLGAGATLLLPANPPPHLSAPGVLRFAGFAIRGVLRGAWDVCRASLRPGRLRPGCLTWRTALPPGRPRRLFAVAITLLPGTLTARLEGEVLIVHALDPGPATRAALAALEARIAGLYGLTTDTKETRT
ncbi:Na+/H+ antiporter subunit E [Pseudoponticoccus marisrubri]|uniref:Cation transporter n=1 Tax=Pseudoponticoccus marisrubri TaxID=1685382 RepID=A0A0W7WDU9_9RHOB|nr:Na+/H+ antiporter subunit E [Pseudoponticoccus marisrubri]KUF08742.1 hypothetical protein AVJ23_21075 [Pseudoponticoccus marisrubri]